MKSNHDIFKNIKSSIKTGQSDGKKELILIMVLVYFKKEQLFMSCLNETEKMRVSTL